ncbi:MAG: helix-turn-helix domain-containing protein [Spirochaetaceae bacterium]|jgi:transcriptional regulator with XRE-family HTH domain|nr:helix-turn-helix domain-containing protein [Spirochaetaceae bacterium]
MISGQDVRALLGRQIRFYRKKRQLSQATLAERADISITFLSSIERGLKYPTSETLSGIANGLGVELYRLFQEIETPAEHRLLLERFKLDITQSVMKSLEAVYAAYED